MIINRVKLNNFRSYKGEVELNFRPNNERNVVLIGGENGAGKSSIFEAIRLCLYGPATYKYKGIVSSYVVRIKKLINEDAYLDKDVKAYVLLDFDINKDGKVINYIIKRSWSFTDAGKFIENVYIMEDKKKMKENEIYDFNNYFKSIIPPSIFDLSFFDGEKLFDFFEDRLVGSKLKETVLILNNLDIFGILSKELELSAKRHERKKDYLKEDLQKFDKKKEIVNNLFKKYNSNKMEIDSLKYNIEELRVNLYNTENEFINAGGLGQDKRDELIYTITNLQNKRDEINYNLKKFSNEKLPFIILKNELRELKTSINMEEKIMTYNALKTKIESFDLYSEISKNIDEDIDLIKKVLEEVNKVILPKDIDKEYVVKHYLSVEDKNKINLFIENILKIEIEDYNFFEEINSITEKIAKKRFLLRNSMEEIEEKKYIIKLEKLNQKLSSYETRLENLIHQNDELKSKLDLENKKLQNLKSKLDSIDRADNIKNLSNKLIGVTEELLVKITNNKRKDIEDAFLNIFSKIMRKSKFIEDISIDNNFEITLYSKKSYTKDDIINLVLNVGLVGIKEKLGDKFLKEIFENEPRSKEEFLIEINKINHDLINISTKIDVMNLSSGEKQIYVMCLYWAIIKTSKVSVPFIIDTPYSRVDQIHRTAITKYYLPKISDQVIILSTNTEVDNEQYSIIKNNLSREYILNYEEKESKTKIEEGYFFRRNN